MSLILAIESSCDESSISLIKNDNIIKTITFSQEKEFSNIGGVIPELAARLHEQNLPILLNKIKEEFDLNDLVAVAVTTSPGLIGCLQMGLQMAKSIALFYDIPLISVDHIAGHIYSGEIEHKYQYPFLSLVVSGGNTQLILVKEEMKFEVIGQTQDDAIGESFDKVARVLKLGYPGGPQIDKISQGIKATIDFPVAKINKYDFSYSGLKSAILNYVNSQKMKQATIEAKIIAASFQKAAITQLINQTQNAINDFDVKQLIVVGGVSANSLLRNSFENLKIPVIFPSLKYCTDNAAMIAKVAYKKYQNKLFSTLQAKATPQNQIKNNV